MQIIFIWNSLFIKHAWREIVSFYFVVVIFCQDFNPMMSSVFSSLSRLRFKISSHKIHRVVNNIFMNYPSIIFWLFTLALCDNFHITLNQKKNSNIQFLLKTSYETVQASEEF
jgi:hypothetical protein